MCLLFSKGKSEHIHKQFNEGFVSNWTKTNCYEKWCQTDHSGLDDIHQGFVMYLDVCQLLEKSDYFRFSVASTVGTQEAFGMGEGQRESKGPYPYLKILTHAHQNRALY